MGWTYSGSPGDNDVDAVRFLTGQVSSADDVIASDEEITWAVGLYSGASQYKQRKGAAVVSRYLASRYAAQPTREVVGELSLTWGDRAKALLDRAEDLDRQAKTAVGVAPYVGGLSDTEWRTDQQDTDLTQPAFWKGMHDNPRVGEASTST